MLRRGLAVCKGGYSGASFQAPFLTKFGAVGGALPNGIGSRRSKFTVEVSVGCARVLSRAMDGLIVEGVRIVQTFVCVVTWLDIELCLWTEVFAGVRGVGGFEVLSVRWESTGLLAEALPYVATVTVNTECKNTAIHPVYVCLLDCPQLQAVDLLQTAR